MSNPLTIADIREAYQSQIPNRRFEFERTLRALKDKCSGEGCLFTRFISEVASAGIAEMRARNLAAKACLQAMVDSGWRPKNPTEIDSAFGDLFSSYNSWERESFSDLYSAVEDAYAGIGNNGPDLRTEYHHQIRNAQVAVYRECVSGLKLYAASRSNLGHTFLGPVGAVQIGDGSIASIAQSGIHPTIQNSPDHKEPH